MRLIYVIDYCFQQTPDGAVWTDTSYSESFWEPYLHVYEEIELVCRVNLVPEKNAAWRQVNNARTLVSPVVNYSGALQYLMNRSLLRRQLKLILQRPGVVMVRMPSNLARCAAICLTRMGRTFGVDVVGDPWCAMAPGVVTIRGRAFFRWLFTKAQKTVCAEAAAVSYVASPIASRYPVTAGASVLICSDVRLDRDWLVLAPRVPNQPCYRLITVATLSQVYKGIDILLKAIAICKSRDRILLELTIVGTGRYRDALEKYSKDLGIGTQITFRGTIPWGPKLIEELDRSDLFVLPSLVEVMPRALLEAMARALPCLATRVGAVSEVLSDRDIVDPGDADKLARSIAAIVSDSERMRKMSICNLQIAKLHESSILMPRWLDFHRELCDRTRLNNERGRLIPFLRVPDITHGFEEQLTGEHIDVVSS